MEKKISCFLMLWALMCSCVHKEVYTKFFSVDVFGWKNEQILHYKPQLHDSLSTHDISLVIRHATTYPYQDIWLAVAYKESYDIKMDTLHLQLADANGQWIGKGSNFIHTITIPFMEGIRFSRNGSCAVSIKQLMTDDPLKGINNIGVVIKRK